MNPSRSCLYGPFPSRRLGWSLGVDMLPEEKTCTYNCVYCEIGETVKGNLVDPLYRLRYPPPVGFAEELAMILQRPFRIDSITFGYNGEPTLNELMLDYLQIIRDTVESLPIRASPPIYTVFTNSSTLGSITIRKHLAQFDRVLAKLDTGTESVYQNTNRPHAKCPSIQETINNLALFRSELSIPHRLVLQCLFYDRVDSKNSTNIGSDILSALAQAIQYIRPHEVQVYTVARMPAEFSIIPVSTEGQQEIVQQLTNQVDDPSIPIISY